MKNLKITERIIMAWFSRKKSLSSIVCFLVFFVLMAGCGYTSKSLINRNVNSIYIPIFDNTTFRRGLEFDLTKAVKDEIMSRTNLRIVQKENADTILNGKINDVSESVLIQNRKDNIVESRLTITVDIELVDRRTGRTLVKENGLKESAEYIVNRGENINSASEENVIRLAEAIVSSFEEKW